MKNLIIAVLLFGISGWAFAQNIVTTTPQKKNVVLEEFTGIHCGYCPDGHKRAEEINAANPGRVVLINIHAGGYAVPQAGEPDFRTIFGKSIDSVADVKGYPAGSVNRHLFSSLAMGTGSAMGRSNWKKAVAEIFPQLSPVNVGFTTSFDSASRVLTVNTELYYTANSPQSTNYIQIALVENHVLGYQSDYAAGTHTDYDHKHILRWLITGQWGDAVNTTSKGSLVTKTYQYTVPVGFNIKNCDVAVYVTESKTEVYTGGVSTAENGSFNGETEVYPGTLVRPAKNIAKAPTTGTTDFTYSMTSALDGTKNFEISLDKDAPGDWSAVFSVNGTEYSSTTVLAFDYDVKKDIIIKVDPGATPDFATFTLKVKPVDFPSFPPQEEKVFVVSGITDLIVNNDNPLGTTSDSNATVWEPVYTASLANAGSTYYASIGSEVFRVAFNNNILDEVGHVYFNVGWTFPSLTDSIVAAFSKFLDKGGNLMISGQDVGWETWDPNGYGTTATKDFYTKYLRAAYVADGSSSNNQLNAVSSDAVLGTVSSSTLVNQYGNDPSNGNPFMYPDELSANTGGLAVLQYNSASKKAAIRSEGGVPYKTMTLGFSIEMVSNVSVRNQIMKNTYDWFHGALSDVEFDQAMEKIHTPYPNPANDLITFLAGYNSEIIIYDVTGKIVGHYYGNNEQMVVNTSSFPEGYYLYKLTHDNISETGNFQVVR